jgi:hypothetical protein
MKYSDIGKEMLKDEIFQKKYNLPKNLTFSNDSKIVHILNAICTEKEKNKFEAKTSTQSITKIINNIFES